ncbi:MAG: hypothetical protein AAGG11_07695 [Pseudomonadota bacterium]
MRSQRSGCGWLLAAALVSGAAVAEERTPQVNYLLHCGGCHLPDGRGAPPVPSLTDEVVQLSDVDAVRRYLVQVPGSSQAPVSDAELAEILNWVFTELRTVPLPAGFTPLTAEEVGSARATVLLDPMGERTRLWNLYYHQQ